MEICAISSNYCIIMIMANLPVSHIQLCIHMYNTSRLKMVQGQKDKDRLLYPPLSLSLPLIYAEHYCCIMVIPSSLESMVLV